MIPVRKAGVYADDWRGRSFWRRLAAAIVLLPLLTHCGGSGGGNPSAPPAGEAAALQEVGKAFDPNAVLATECASATDPAQSAAAVAARYPKATGVFRGWPTVGTDSPPDYATPLRLRSDRAGGFVVSHHTAAGGAMFWVAPGGDKVPLSLPYASTFDVAADGRIWFVRNGTLSVGTKEGAVTNLALEGGPQPPADGPLGSSPLGPISLIAAGRNKVYLLIESGAVNLGVQPPTSSLVRSLRVLTRVGQDGWTVRTVSLPADVRALDVISAMRAGPADELLILLNQPFKQLLSQETVWPGALATQYAGAASVRRMDTGEAWTEAGSTSFSLAVVPNSTHGYLTYSYSLDAKDLAVDAGGKVWVSGAGAIYAVDSINGWRAVASSRQYPVDVVGQDGPTEGATFADAGQIAADGGALTFYDGEACQIRRLQGDRLATLSGPVLVTPTFAGAGFVGQRGGDLLFSYGLAATGESQSQYGRYMTLPGLAAANVTDPAFVPVKGKSLASRIGNPTCRAGTSYWAGTPACHGAAPATAAGAWMGMGTSGPIARAGSDFVAGLEAGSGTIVGSTRTWPGILNGDAPSGPSGVHVDGQWLYLFGTVRTDPPVNLSASQYHEVRLYRADLATGVASALAGKTIASAVYAGQRIDLSAVIPTVGAGPAFVQVRSDGRLWLANGKEVWVLDGEGRLRRVAGLSTSGAVGVDATGDAASFALISSIRVLPDNRLLIVDQGAHAVRLLTDDGRVVTLVGRLNLPGRATGPLPGVLDRPLDAFPVGKDIYISTQASRNLLRASNAL